MDASYTVRAMAHFNHFIDIGNMYHTNSPRYGTCDTYSQYQVNEAGPEASMLVLNCTYSKTAADGNVLKPKQSSLTD